MVHHNEILREYSNELIYCLGHLFTYGTSKVGTYLEQGAYWGQGSYIFFEKQENVKWLISGSLLNRGTYSNYQKKFEGGA